MAGPPAAGSALEATWCHRLDSDGLETGFGISPLTPDPWPDEIDHGKGFRPDPRDGGVDVFLDRRNRRRVAVVRGRMCEAEFGGFPI